MRASLGLVVILGALGGVGCLSNEYRIPGDELRRLAQTAPEARGDGVRVSQQLGARRAEAVEPPPSAPPAYRDSDTELGDVGLRIGLDVGGGGSGRASGGGSGGGWRGGGGPAPSGGFHGSPPGGFHGSPPGVASGSSGGGWRGGGGVPAPKGGGGLNLPNIGGGGGGSGDGAAAVLVVVAVVAVVAATYATIGLAASEGMRYEGHAQVSPGQLVHLKSRGREDLVALGDLTPEQAATADEALVMDDEGYGLRRLDHAPLDRTGPVFRFDAGVGEFTLGDARASGVSAHIQAGGYFTNTLGLVVDVGLGGGSIDPCCSGALAPSGMAARHSLGLEAQFLPLGLGPVHLGAFGGGGVAIASAASAGASYETGPMASGGALLEIDLTSHMSLALRGGASRAWLPSGPSSAGTITGGLAIY